MLSRSCTARLGRSHIKFPNKKLTFSCTRDLRSTSALSIVVCVNEKECARSALRTLGVSQR